MSYALKKRFFRFLLGGGYYLLYLLSGIVAAVGIAAFLYIKELIKTRKVGDFLEIFNDLLAKDASLVLMVSYILVFVVAAVVFKFCRKSMVTYTGMSYAYPFSLFGAIILGAALNLITYFLVPSADVAVEEVSYAFMFCLIAGPFVEEFIFRGVLLKMFAGSCGILLSIFITSFLFAVSHTEPVQMTYSFFLGIVLCVVRLKSTSFWSAAMIHLTFNLSGAVLATCEFEFPDIGYAFLPFLALLSFLLACAGGRKLPKENE